MIYAGNGTKSSSKALKDKALEERSFARRVEGMLWRESRKGRQGEMRRKELRNYEVCLSDWDYQCD